MCARRFLFVIAFLTVLFVAGAFLLYQFGSSVLVRQAIPDGHYAAPAPSGAPDYADAASWLARPGMERDPALWVPQDLTPPESTGSAAIFYVHPTTYLGKESWNAALHPDAITEGRSKIFVESQAGAFNAAGEIWAPRYRQAAYGSFLLGGDDSRQALDLAYRDVSKAFDQFLTEAGDKPIILAGHSQGSLLLVRLLKDRIAGSPVQSRILAAYVAGWPISRGADLPALGLPACAGNDDTNCLLAWMSFKDPANPARLYDSWLNEDGFTGKPRSIADMVCVNPLTGSSGGTAPPAANPGTLVPTTTFTAARLEAGRVGASCKDGLLIIDGDIPNLGPFVLPGNNYHVFDYALFWAAIRADAMHRLSKWPE